jgi:hypothetical protein
MIFEKIQQKHIAEAYAVDPEFGLMIWALTVIDDLKKNKTWKRNQ